MEPAGASEGERYAMKEDASIVALHQPGAVEDSLTEIAREGARRMLAFALDAEVEAFLDRFGEERLPDGRRRVVWHGHGSDRTIQTGIGALEVQRPKVRDRAADAEDERVRFTSHILLRWSRRSRSLDALPPVLYLRGVSTGTQHQCCWGERRPGIGPADRSSLERAEPGTANVLNKVPKSIQPAVKSDLRDIPLP